MIYYKERAYLFEEELSYDYDREASIYIIASQVASDIGKIKSDKESRNVAVEAMKKYDLELINKIEAAIRFDYAIKDVFIALAIKKVSHSKRFKYHISIEPDQNGYESIMVYFEWEGGKKQVSFHTYLYDKYGDWTNCGSLIYSMKNRSRDVYIKWDKKVNGSRQACLDLLKEFY